MQVQLKTDDITISLGNNGIVLKIWDNAGTHVGDLRIGKAKINWMRGRTREAGGKKLSVEKFLALLDSA